MLTASVKKEATELTRDGALVWVEWLQRGERGGSYLRAIGRTIGVQGSNYVIQAGPTFVFKAPDQPAREFTAAQAILIPKGKNDLSTITKTIEGQARLLREPVTPWTGEVRLPFLTRTEIKKDWTDGDIVEVDWASGGIAGDNGRKYFRVVRGSILPDDDGLLSVEGLYRIPAGTVFDMKDQNEPVKRHTAFQTCWIDKMGKSTLGDIYTFLDK